MLHYFFFSCSLLETKHANRTNIPLPHSLDPSLSLSIALPHTFPLCHQPHLTQKLRQWARTKWKYIQGTVWEHEASNQRNKQSIETSRQTENHTNQQKTNQKRNKQTNRESEKERRKEEETKATNKRPTFQVKFPADSKTQNMLQTSKQTNTKTLNIKEQTYQTNVKQDEATTNLTKQIWTHERNWTNNMREQIWTNDATIAQPICVRPDPASRQGFEETQPPSSHEGQISHGCRPSRSSSCYKNKKTKV